MKVNAAVLIGVPVSLEEFTTRISESDWLRKFDRPEGNRKTWLAEYWQSEYSPIVAQPLVEMVTLARNLGADVRTGATLVSLHDVTAVNSVVILFSHWKGPEVVRDDIIGSPGASAFLARAEADQSPLVAWVSERLRELANEEGNVGKPISWSWRTLFQPRHPRFHSVREILSEAIHNPRIPDHSQEMSTEIVVESPVTQMERRRVDLDRVFEGLLRPGNRLELFDGLHSKQDVESALQTGFTGTLDLTTCNSTVLSDYIGAKRGQRIRTVQFPAVQELAWHAQCVALALQIVADHGTNYQEARHNAAEIVTRAVLELAPQPK